MGGEGFRLVGGGVGTGTEVVALTLVLGPTPRRPHRQYHGERQLKGPVPEYPVYRLFSDALRVGEEEVVPERRIGRQRDVLPNRLRQPCEQRVDTSFTSPLSQSRPRVASRGG